jgi:hypothetical protein
MGLLEGFADFATRNRDSQGYAGSTQIRSIPSDVLENFYESNPDARDDYSVDPEDVEGPAPVAPEFWGGVQDTVDGIVPGWVGPLALVGVALVVVVALGQLFTFNLGGGSEA